MRGFTLIEAIVVVALTAILMGAIGSLTRFMWAANTSASANASALTSARMQLSRMAAEIRTASSTISAATDSYVFADPSGATITETASSTTFAYLDANGSALVAPVDPAAVRVVRMTYTRTAPPLTLVEIVAPRNLYHP